MEIALTNDEEIIMILSRKIYIPEIVYKIIQWKHKLEDKNTLNYHIERWETISSKYFRSLEKDYHGVVIPQSYSIDSKYFVSNKDKCLEFYNETGISYQVIELLHELIKKSHDKEWLKYDDNLYSMLANKIMIEMNKR